VKVFFFKQKMEPKIKLQAISELCGFKCQGPCRKVYVNSNFATRFLTIDYWIFFFL